MKEGSRFEGFTAVTMKNAVFWVLCRVALIRTEEPHDVTSEKTEFFMKEGVFFCQ
jgi:hypothetical protein